MEISDYFSPVDFDKISIGNEYKENQLGRKLVINPISLDGIDLAIISISEDRGATKNGGCANGAEIIREYLYNLYEGPYHLKVADLGTIKAGNSITDTYFAIQELSLIHI